MYGGSQIERGPFGDLFLAEVTAITVGTGDQAGQWLYSWTEQTFDVATGLPSDADTARQGTATNSPALEVNNAELTPPFYAWMRLKGVVRGIPCYEFSGPVLSAGPDDTVNYYDTTLNFYDSTVDITDVNFNILPPGPYNGGWDCPACWSGYPLTWLAKLLFPAAWAPFNSSFTLRHSSGCTWTLGTPGSAVYLSLSYDPGSTTWYLIGQAGAKFFSYKTLGPQDCSSALTLTLVLPSDPTLPTTILLQVGTPWIPRARSPITWWQRFPGTATISQPAHTICDCSACPSGYPPAWVVSFTFHAALGGSWILFNGEWTLLYQGNCTWIGLSLLPAAQGLTVALGYDSVRKRWNLVGLAPDGTSFTYSSNSDIYGGYGWLCCPQTKNSLFFQAAANIPAKFIWPGVAVQDQLNAPPQSLDVKPGAPCIPCRSKGKCDCPSCPGGYPTAWSVPINFPGALGANWTAFNKTWVLDQYVSPCSWSNAAPGAQNAMVVTLYFDAGGTPPGWRLQGFSVNGVAFSYFLGGGQQGQAGWDCCGLNTLVFDTANGVPAGQNLKALVPNLTAQPASDCIKCTPLPNRKIAFQKHLDPVVIGDGGNCDCTPCLQGVPSAWQIVLEYLPDYDDASLAEISGEWILSYEGKCSWAAYGTAITASGALVALNAPYVTLVYDAIGAQFVLKAFTSAGPSITYTIPATSWKCCNANWLSFANSTNLPIAIPANKGPVLLSPEGPCSPCGRNPVRPALRLGAKMFLALNCQADPSNVDYNSDPTAWMPVSEQPASYFQGATLHGMIPQGGALGEPGAAGQFQFWVNAGASKTSVLTIKHASQSAAADNQFHSPFAADLNVHQDQLVLLQRDECALNKWRAWPLGVGVEHVVGGSAVTDPNAVLTEGPVQGIQMLLGFEDTAGALPAKMTKWSQGLPSAIVWEAIDDIQNKRVLVHGYPAIGVAHNSGIQGTEPTVDFLDATGCGTASAAGVGVAFILSNDTDNNMVHVQASVCQCPDGAPTINVPTATAFDPSTCTLTFQTMRFDCQGRFLGLF